MTSAERDETRAEHPAAAGLVGEQRTADRAAEAALVTAAPELMAESLGEYTRILIRRIRSGESGALPVILGLVAIVVFFQVKNSLFLSAVNLVNLMTQAAFLVTFGMAEVFVLLLGEIDLSVGYLAANGAVITAYLLSGSHPVPWWVAVLAGLAFTSLWGAIQGLIITKLGLPSFVVTLGGLLGGASLLLYLTNLLAPFGGTIDLTNNILSDIDSGNSLTPTASWIVMVAAVLLGGAFMMLRDSRRRASKLAAPPASVTLLKIALMAIAGVAVVLIGNTNRATVGVLRGVPWVVIVILVLLIAWTVLLSRTRFGRWFLLGRPRATPGISPPSSLASTSNTLTGGQSVLYGAAAAVIGGTS